MLLTSTLGNWGLFAAELLEDSYQLLGMVEMGLAPAFLGGVSARDTPVRIIMLQCVIPDAILRSPPTHTHTSYSSHKATSKLLSRVCAVNAPSLLPCRYVIIALLVSLDFESILCIDNFFSAAAAALEFVALIKLRVSRPELARAYHIPLSGTLPLSLFLSLPIAVSLAVCYVTLVEAADSAGIIVCGLLVGVALYLPFALGWAGEMDSRRLSRAAAEVSPKLAPTATGALLGFHYGSQRTVSRVGAISSRRSSGLF